MENEMKPCPFCGKEEAICHKENPGSYIVECDWCRAASRRRPTKELSIKEWNKRNEKENE